MPTDARSAAWPASQSLEPVQTGTLAMLAWAIAATALPVVFHLSGQMMGIAVCILLAFLMTQLAAAALPIALIFSWLFQSVFISIVSPGLDDDGLKSVRA